MPDIDWNRSTWSGGYDWSGAGEEWSGPWATSAGEWFATIMPRIGAVLPAESVLEIAPGFGRWTDFLLRFTNSYCGIDLSEKCIAGCRQRFRGRPNADFILNDGRSLAAVAGRTFNLVFSFDSLVHADLDAVEHYVPQVIALLAPCGIAFLHHSNLAALPGVSFGHRSEDVSAAIVADLIQSNGGRVLIQELICWGEDKMTDCFSMFCRKGDYTHLGRHDFTDLGSMATEAHCARQRFQHYQKLR